MTTFENHLGFVQLYILWTCEHCFRQIVWFGWLYVICLLSFKYSIILVSLLVVCLALVSIVIMLCLYDLKCLVLPL